MRSFRSLLLCMGLYAGCSSNDGGGGNATDGGADGGDPPLTCDWLAGDNCWKTTLAMAASCLPPAADFGTFNAQNTTCTYANGAVITFDTPVTLPVPTQAPPFKFTVASGGQTCLRFDETTAGFTVTAGGQTFTLRLLAEPSVEVTCPGGMTFFADNFFDLLTCPAGSMGVPGTSWLSNAAGLTFDLKGAGTASQLLPIFDCRRP
jgi:hypothetical protein